MFYGDKKSCQKKYFLALLKKNPIFAGSNLSKKDKLENLTN